MKEAVAKTNKTKAGSKIDKLLARFIKKKERRLESIRLEVKKENLQQTTQKYKDS